MYLFRHHTDTMLYTPSPSVFLFQKVSAFKFDLMFSLFNGDVCVRFSSSATLPDSNAYEVCSGMCAHLIRHSEYSASTVFILLSLERVELFGIILYHLNVHLSFKFMFFLCIFAWHALAFHDHHTRLVWVYRNQKRYDRKR
jgi:hypothetical protein